MAFPDNPIRVESEFSSLSRAVSSQLRNDRITAGQIGSIVKVPTVRNVFVDPSTHSPAVLLDCEFSPYRHKALDLFRANPKAAVQTDLDGLLLTLCDVYDSHPGNISDRYIGEHNDGKAERDIYLSTAVIQNGTADVARLVGTILGSDYANGKQIFGSELFDTLKTSTRDLQEQHVRQVTYDRTQAAYKRLIGWNETNEYLIRRQVENEFPTVTDDNFIDELVRYASGDMRILDTLLDQCLFARLGIPQIPRDLNEPAVVQTQTGNTIKIAPSEDGLFDCSFEQDLGDVTRIYIESIEGNKVSFVHPTNEGGDPDTNVKGVVLKASAAQMDYKQLRVFLAENLIKHNGSRGNVLKRKNAPSAHIQDLRFDELTVEVPEDKKRRELTLMLCEGNLDISLNEDVKLTVSHHMAENIKVFANGANVRIVESNNVETLDIKSSSHEQPVILEGGIYSKIKATDAGIQGNSVQVEQIIGIDASGSITHVGNSKVTITETNPGRFNVNRLMEESQ